MRLNKRPLRHYANFRAGPQGTILLKWDFRGFRSRLAEGNEGKLLLEKNSRGNDNLCIVVRLKFLHVCVDFVNYKLVFQNV